jgi:hypothetical protein
MICDLNENNILADDNMISDSGANLEFQLFTSFVREKNALLSYVHDLVRLAAKTSGIELSGILKQGECNITSAKASHLTCTRIIVIVSLDFLSFILDGQVLRATDHS